MRLLLAAAAFAAVALSGCATTANQDPIQAIQQACADDAALRPEVTRLLAIPDLASPKTITAVAGARVMIDGICAAPTASDRVRLIQAVSSVVSVYIELKTAKAAKAASAPGT